MVTISKQKLPNNMRKVLCGISCYPDASNKMLAKRISVNPSTISTSRQRLKVKNLIQKKYIPYFFNIDMGVVVVATGRYRYQFPDDIRESILGLVIHPAIPFFIASDNICWMVIGIVPPGKEESIGEVSSSLGGKYMNEIIYDENKILFHIENTQAWRYFDYHTLLSKKLKIDFPPRRHFPSSSWSPDTLKKNERLVLQSLINDPDLSDFKRSQIIDLSHPTITKLRKALIDRRILKTIIKPNLMSLGFSNFAWFNIKLGGEVIEKKLTTMLCNYPNNIFSIYDIDNVFMLSVFEDLNDIMLEQHKINEFMSEAMMSYDDLTFNYFYIENPNFTFKLNSMQATQGLIGLLEGEKDILSLGPEQQLAKMLKKFFSAEETSSIIFGIKKSLRMEALKINPLEMVRSMILELLTEPKYLLLLKEKERTVLQVELIEKLNSLRAEIEKSAQFGGKRKTNKVLIVEDSKVMRNLLKDMAIEANFNVVGAVDNGQGAFDLYRNLSESNNRPDVVLMDVFIKGLNGVEATRMIKEYDPKACIIVLTSSLNHKVKNEMISIGVEKYLIKPVTGAQLINGIEQSMAKRIGMIK